MWLSGRLRQSIQHQSSFPIRYLCFYGENVPVIHSSCLLMIASDFQQSSAFLARFDYSKCLFDGGVNCNCAHLLLLAPWPFSLGSSSSSSIIHPSTAPSSSPLYSFSRKTPQEHLISSTRLHLPLLRPSTTFPSSSLPFHPSTTFFFITFHLLFPL